MKSASVRLITADLDRMVAFYERVPGVAAERPAPVFAELVTSGATLALGHVSTAALFGESEVEAAPNRGITIDWQVDDVDAEYERLRADGDTWTRTPTLMPWGNRSAILRDPDGNLVNLYSPATDAARARVAGR